MGGNGRPRINDEKKAMIRNIFTENAIFSLRTTDMQIRVYHTTIWNFLRRELELYPYKLQISEEINELEKLSRVSFARYCLNALKNDSVFIK